MIKIQYVNIFDNFILWFSGYGVPAGVPKAKPGNL